MFDDLTQLKKCFVTIKFAWTPNTRFGRKSFINEKYLADDVVIT